MSNVDVVFVLKLIEGAVATQPMGRLLDNTLMDVFQSAFREGFTAQKQHFSRAQNYILMDLDKGNKVLLVLLDLSAAFDTFDHEIVLNRLSIRCDIGGTAQKWLGMCSLLRMLI